MKVRTVSVGLHLKDITDISREELLELFARNGELVSANFSVVKVPVAGQEEDGPAIIDEGEDLVLDEDNENEAEMRDMLIIQTKLPFEAFSPDDFGGFIQNLLFQAELFLTDGEDDENGELGDPDDDSELDDDFDD